MEQKTLLKDIEKYQTANIRGGSMKACADITRYINRHGTEVMHLYVQKWLNSQGKLSYQTRGNELALISKDADEETIMFIIDGYMDEIKMFSHSDLFEQHTREVTWYFNSGVLIAQKVEEY